MNLAKNAVKLAACILTCSILDVTIGLSTNNEEELENERKPVKLTMKQGLVMNQVIGTYTLNDPQDPLCRKHSEEYRIGLRAMESWALQMFDSSSKLQSGILMGNLVEYGAFKQCLRIYKATPNGPIRGKHCTFRIILGERILRTVMGFHNVSQKRFDLLKKSIIEGVRFMWSVCIPDSCPSSDVFPHFNKTISELVHGLDITVTLAEENCMTLSTRPEWSSKEYSFLILAACIIFGVSVCTIIDLVKRDSNHFVKIFSAISNGQKLLARKTNHELNCLHGIRFLSTCYVMFGHRFMTGMLFPSINSLELIDWVLEYTSTLIIGGTVCVDSFLFVSGMLVSYGFFENVTKNNRFNAVLFYVYRYIRITLPLSVAVILYSTFIQYFGEGPLWRETYQAMQLPCQYFWWSTLLHIQNYVNPQALCIPQTWYLTCEMVYYYFSPVILYPLWKLPKVGWVILALSYIASVGINFSLAWTQEYPGGMPLTSQLFHTEYFQRHYIAPHVRASPYIIGLGFGYTIFKTKGKKISLGLFWKLLGWIVALIFLLCVVLGSHVFQEENHDYNRLESSLYLSCSRSAWVLGIAWIIWACVQGYGGFVNDILSLHVFRILGRLGYGIFLFHMCFQFLKDGSGQMPAYFSNFHMLYDCFGDLAIMIAVGALFALCFEYPCLTIETLLFEKNPKKILFKQTISNLP
ncbi:nose resistant to fluoxetine protein 6-like [Tribolium madens]|uniref:nose resistant to fluoxetine protein 6-like n=1 Tax=Tribolium madens TaxID=41895 RepID=UPI001CF7346F|nr:nose resistant to fluoxetine protein 6-like [Tribolium madens]